MSSKEQIVKYIVKDLNIRFTYVNATELAKSLSIQNKYSHVANYTASKCCVGAILLACQSKPGQKLGLYIESTNILGNVYVETNYLGHTRAYVEKASATMDESMSEKGVQGIIGKNKKLSITETTPGLKTPHVGLVSTVGGDVNEEISNYLNQSRQIKNICSISCVLDDGGNIIRADGFVIELLQDVDKTNMDLIVQNIQNSPRLSEFSKQDASPSELVEQYLKGFVLERVDCEHDICLKCSCSPEKTYATLKMLGKEELMVLAEKPEGQKITCQMCGKSYDYTQTQMRFVANNTKG